MKDLYAILDQLEIDYEIIEHPALFTGKDEAKYDIDFQGAAQAKNLLLRNRDRSEFYLVILSVSKQANLKVLQHELGETHLSFASDKELKEKLNITPGSVSPFTLIYNDDNSVKVLVDEEFMESPMMGFHPNDNTKTLNITQSDFKKFLDWSGNQYRIVGDASNG